MMYKLAANFCSPVLPHWIEVCATSIPLLLTVAKESVSQSTQIILYCNMESSVKCFGETSYSDKVCKAQIFPPCFFFFLYRHTFPKHLQCCV